MKKIIEMLDGYLFYLVLFPFLCLKHIFSFLVKVLHYPRTADFKERILTYETAKGFYLTAGGIGVIWTLIFAIQYSTYALGGVIGWYLISEGLRKIFVNRTKQKLNREELLNRRKDQAHVTDTRN